MSTIIILDTPVSLEKEFKISLKKIFGFGYTQLRYLNKVFGINTRSIYKMKELNVQERTSISFYLPDLNIFGSDLKKKLSLEQDKFFSLNTSKSESIKVNFLNLTFSSPSAVVSSFSIIVNE